MGKFIKGVLGGFSGKIGTVIGSNIKTRSVSVEKMGMIWKGIGVGLILGLIMLGMWRKVRKAY